ncbi:MAG: PfkB family carbohydrate kinase [Planctomycetota bacterium]
MSLIVGGSVALDTLETPHGRADRVFGGSASYFAYAASFLTKASLVGVIGHDFPDEYLKVLEGRGISLAGLERSPKPTFSWHGKYHENMNNRDTLHVDLSIFEGWQVKVPSVLQNADTVCLANMSPKQQLMLLQQCKNPRFVVADTMNLWIEIERDALFDVIRASHLFILNDEEARQLTENDNLIVAGKSLLKRGPRYVVVKKGEHGALLIAKEGTYSIGAYPLEKVFDPTGAGDCFAGGLAGYLDKTGDLSFKGVKEALLAGTTAASFCVEDFSFHRLRKLTDQEFNARLAALRTHVTL